MAGRRTTRSVNWCHRRRGQRHRRRRCGRDGGDHRRGDRSLRGGSLAHRDGRLDVVDRRRIELRGHRPLDFHRSAGCEDRRSHKRGDVTRSRSNERSTGARRSAKRENAAARPARGGPAAGAAPEPNHPGQCSERPDYRSEGCQLTTDMPKLRAVLPTSGAVVEVAARHAAGTDAAVVGRGEIAPDLPARRVAGFVSGGQANPRPDKQRLHCGNRQAQDASDLAVGHPAQLAHQKRGALLIW